MTKAIPPCEFCNGPYRFHQSDCRFIAQLYERTQLRDQFAMAALTGIFSITGGMEEGERGTIPAFVSDLAYETADAMMEARKSTGASTPSETPKEST